MKRVIWLFLGLVFWYAGPNAPAVSAVVEHVRGIGMNQQIVAATVAKAREQRLTALREEAPALEREAVDESDLARTLAVFDPVRAALAPR